MKTLLRYSILWILLCGSIIVSWAGFPNGTGLTLYANDEEVLVIPASPDVTSITWRVEVDAAGEGYPGDVKLKRRTGIDPETWTDVATIETNGTTGSTSSSETEGFIPTNTPGTYFFKGVGDLISPPGGTTETNIVTIKVCRVADINVENGATDDLDGDSAPANTDVCAAIKGSGYVQVVAILDPVVTGGDALSPNLVSWSGGTDAGDILKRKFTKANWAKETLTANCGTSSYSQIVYIIGAQSTGYEPADGQSSTNRFADNSQGFTSTGVIGAPDGDGIWRNRCEIEFTIKPDVLLTDGNDDIIAKSKVNWDVSRDKRTKYWKNIGGTWSITEDHSASWESDDGGQGDEDNNPWDGNGHVYGTDQPGINGTGDARVQKMNMREWVRVGLDSTTGPNGTICSDYYYWHTFVSIRKNGANWELDNTYDNEIPSGNSYWGNIPVTGITITSTTLPNGTVNTAYNQTLASTGGTTPISWTVDSGILPPGLSLSSSGTISGTPTTAGIYTFTVEAEDSSTPHASDLQQLSITITN